MCWVEQRLGGVTVCARRETLNVNKYRLYVQSSQIGIVAASATNPCGSISILAAIAAPPAPEISSVYSLDDSFAAILRKIECEDPVEVCWTSQHFGMAQRTYGVVITGLPMILHRDARKLVIFRMALVVFCPII